MIRIGELEIEVFSLTYRSGRWWLSFLYVVYQDYEGSLLHVDSEGKWDLAFLRPLLEKLKGG